MEEYPKKSYKGFILWMVCFCLAMGAIPFGLEACAPDMSVGLMIRIIDFLMCVGVETLFYMIYRNGRIYWYNKYSYEQAKAMSEDERREIALRPLTVFFKITLVSMVLFVTAEIFGLPWWLDFTVFIIVFVVSAFRV